MNTLKNTPLLLLVSLLFLWRPSVAGAAGFALNWTPFTIDKNLELNTDHSSLSNPLRKFPLENLGPFDESNHPFLHEINHGKSSVTPERKSLWDNVKIAFSPSSEDQDQRNNFRDVDTDIQVSRFLNSLHGFIYGDEKMKSLEEIGKVIQPQINFYLEF